MQRFYYNRIFLTVFFLFILLPVFLYFVFAMKRDYIHHQVAVDTNIIKTKVKGMISLKKQSTLNLSMILSNNLSIATNIENGNFEVLERAKNSLVSSFMNYQNIWIQYFDVDGVSQYRSWTQNGNIPPSYRRSDITALIKQSDPKSQSSIDIGAYDLTFKGISPLYSLNGRLLGYIEVMTHFNSIATELESEGIESAVLVEERYKSQLLSTLSKKFIGEYYVANLDIKENIEIIISSLGVEKLPITKAYELIDDYYVIGVPIYNSAHERIAVYYAFINNKNFEEVHALETKASYLVFSFIAGYLLLFVLLFRMSQKIAKDTLLTKKYSFKLKNDDRVQTQGRRESLYIDGLTGAFKRAKLDEDIKNFKDTTIIMLNIDNFSHINSYYGFRIGDEVLVKVVKRLQQVSSNRIYRINGDEFVIFEKNYMELIEVIKSTFIQVPLEIETLQFRLRFSFGIHLCNKGEGGIREASMALKKAKKLGKNRFVVYSEENLQKRRQFVQFNDILFNALDNNQIVPFFQGIHNNKSGKIQKYEALARIVNGDEVYTPAEFSDVAKVGGFLTDITKVIIEKSLLFLKDNEYELSINITEDDLQSDYLIDYLQVHCKANRVDTSRITLEIVEGISTAETQIHLQQLGRLKDCGFKIAIDDFGVEYSNFERIAQLDIDYIKIDGKYIKEIHTNEKYYKIVASIVYFAKSIGLEVVVEYVESQEIQNKIEELDIEFSQGYLFSKPEPYLKRF